MTQVAPPAEAKRATSRTPQQPTHNDPDHPPNMDGQEHDQSSKDGAQRNPDHRLVIRAGAPLFALILAFNALIMLIVMPVLNWIFEEALRSAGMVTLDIQTIRLGPSLVLTGVLLLVLMLVAAWVVAIQLAPHCWLELVDRIVWRAADRCADVRGHCCRHCSPVGSDGAIGPIYARSISHCRGANRGSRGSSGCLWRSRRHRTIGGAAACPDGKVRGDHSA